jgi:hypothetical protein
MIRVTVACPEALIPDARHLAMCLARGPEDADTYATPSWQDADGNLYACASFEAPVEWLGAAQSPLARPAWDAEPYTVNMAAANRAQSKMTFWTPASETPAPTANTAQMLALGGPSGIEALAMLGLTPVGADEA